MATMMIGVCIMLIYLCIMLAIVQWKGDTSIGNFTWGGGVMIMALYTFFVMSMWTLRQIVITSMIVLWALRLIGYVYLRYDGKDPRYTTWKWQGTKALGINTIWIFGQAFLIAIMSYPVVVVNRSLIQPPLGMLALLGCVLWAVGWLCELLSDYQLFVFRRNPANRGRVMRYGLWRYSRHPNYFGEVLMWWSVFLVAVGVPSGLMTIIAPLTISCMLLFVTGIPWVEKAMESNPEYQEYKKHTSVFIPWFPK